MVPEHHCTPAEGLVFIFNHPTGMALPRDEAQSIEFCACKLFNFHTFKVLQGKSLSPFYRRGNKPSKGTLLCH